jgi:hypothetical protein
VLPRLALLPLVLLALPARAGQLELEVGGGVGFASAVAPALSLRAGYDLWDHLTLSARYVGVDQPTQSQYDGTGNSPVAYQAWAAMAEVRGHTAGTIQLNLALAFGVGEAGLQYPGVTGAEHGGLAPAGQLTAGTRLRLPAHFWTAFDFGVDLYTGLDIPQPGGGSTPGGLDGGFITLLCFGWSPG